MDFTFSEKANCFGENVITMYELGRDFTFKDLEFLKVFKYLTLLDFLPKAFVKIDRPGFFVLKTAIGMDRIEVTFKRYAPLITRTIFETQLKRILNPNEFQHLSCRFGALEPLFSGFLVDESICTGCLECIPFRKQSR